MAAAPLLEPQTVGEAWQRVLAAEKAAVAAYLRTHKRPLDEDVAEASSEAKIAEANRLGFAFGTQRTPLHMILRDDPGAGFTCDPIEKVAVEEARSDVDRLDMLTFLLAKTDDSEERYKSEAAERTQSLLAISAAAGMTLDRLIALVKTSNAMRQPAKRAA